ncbi:hypothetical protein BKA63DRAFT_118097 [Paraphoma chrysanthemicola]|nr:hypothetical protein BKA63DRAFT_118097 [Paraphoma chrysanthemicola]
MLFKSIFLSGAILAFSANEVAAHAAINPALGVQGTAVRNDVEKPSNNKPCGNADLAAIDTSTAVTADASGSFTVDVKNFNGGKDGSRQVTMQVDAAGTATNFVAGQVTANGQAAPAATGTEQVTASLPAGTKCTGGASGNLCLASFKTAAGFGNCVVVQQGVGGGAAAGAANNGNTAAGNTGTAAGNTNGKGNGNLKNNGQNAATGNTGAATGSANANGKGKGQNNAQNAAAGKLMSS